MTETDLRREAERLYDQRQEELKEQAERDQEAERERGIQGAIKEIQQQRRRERMERRRKEAEAEAAELARRRRVMEELIEERASALLDSLNDLKTLDSQHRAALREAGHNPGHEHALATIVPPWFAHRFGGFRSITGVLGAHPTGKGRTLAERDPLAEPGATGATGDADG